MKRLLVYALVFLLTFSLVIPAGASVSKQTNTPEIRAPALLEKMTPEERIGQLFLVTFTGSEVTPDSLIYDLIVNWHIGGVTLQASNDNFLPQPDTVLGTYNLISDLQQVEWDSSFGTYTDPITGVQQTRAYVPLFISLEQSGDGFPDDQIMRGLSPLPSLMAIGATWKTNLAQQTGAVLGQELSALGVNLYLGPALDVLDIPKPAGEGDPGASVFGGDPFWVGEMGRAYISGLHNGSNGRLLAVARHFPGRGSSDRPPDEEVATVRKSLEQLKQIELAPFFAVTGNASSPDLLTDGLLVSHIRYQGLQGNIRATTRPVSFDQTALAEILKEEPFTTWRDQGGIMVSDDLGTLAVRRFADPGGQGFAARLVARDALNAGNDLLYMGNIVSSDAPDNYTTIIRTLEYFAQKYREDTAFSARVDDAVVRILTQKYRIYPNFGLSYVEPPASGIETIGQSQIGFEVARQAATLISPDAEDFDAIFSGPPELYDRIVFLTDVRQGQQCSTCPMESVLGVDALENVVLRLYGPDAGAQVTQVLLNSYSFEDLELMLSGDETPLIEDLRRAHWVIISVADMSQSQAEYRLLRQFLTERQNLLRNKSIVFFAFGAPYYLDATDISKLTVYYGLYSKSPAFVEVAARLLFQEISPTGSSPVSIPGIGYDLIQITAPNPNQIISLALDLPPLPPLDAPVTPEATPIPVFDVGDMVTVKTSAILDHNGHLVPDGTVVRFTLTIGSDQNAIFQQLDATTTRGIARVSFRIDKPGLLELRASSEPATVSDTLLMDVSDTGVAVTIVAPTPIATETFPVTDTPEPTPEPRPALPLIVDIYPGLGGWLLAAMAMVIFTGLAHWIGSTLLSARWGTRWALCGLLGALVAFNYLALGLPGAARLIESGGILSVLGLTFSGGILGWLACWFWWRISVTGSK